MRGEVVKVEKMKIGVWKQKGKKESAYLARFEKSLVPFFKKRVYLGGWYKNYKQVGEYQISTSKIEYCGWAELEMSSLSDGLYELYHYPYDQEWSIGPDQPGGFPRKVIFEVSNHEVFIIS